MKEFTEDQLKEILNKHKLWLEGEEGGECADLSAADLRFADLSAANLRHANLSAANLSAADLSAADLSAADLSAANLRHANLSAADLSAANLRHANLSAADLSAADLSAADLSAAAARLDFGGWSICVRHDVTSIGCRTYKNEDWLEWLPDDVASFDPKAKDWWQMHGDAVKAVIRCVITKHETLQATTEVV